MAQKWRNYSLNSNNKGMPFFQKQKCVQHFEWKMKLFLNLKVRATMEPTVPLT